MFYLLLLRLLQWITSHKNETIIVAVSFVVHLIASLWLFHRFGDTVLYFENEDALGYMDIARHLAAGDGFVQNGMVAGVRTPLYPMVLALLLLLRLPMPWALLLLQNVIASVAGMLLYRIGTMFFLSKRIGMIAAMLYILEPYMIMTANLATTETLFNLLLLCFLYAFGKWYVREPSHHLLAWSAFWLGLAVLTRPVAQYLPIVVLVLILMRWWLKDKDLRALVRSAALFLVIFFAVLSPWMLRQQGQFGTLRLTNIDANMLYFRIAPIVVSEEEGVSYVAAIAHLKARLLERYPEYTDEQSLTFAYYDFMVGEAKKLVARHPGIVAKYYALSLIPGLTGTGYEYMLEAVFGLERSHARVSFTELLLRGDMKSYLHALSQIDVFQLVLFLGAGLWALAELLIFWSLVRTVEWKNAWPVFAILIAFGGYCIFFSLGPQVHARYRMPSFPFLFLLFAYAVHQLYERTLHRHSRVQ